MTRTAPLSDAEQIADLVEFGLSEADAAQKVRERQAHAAELAETIDPAVLLPAIRDAIKLRARIERVVKTISDPKHYRIETDVGTVRLGPASRWAARPSEFSAPFLDIAEMPTLPKAGPARNALFTMIARAAESEDIGPEATDHGETMAWLGQYIANRPPVDSFEEAEISEYPFIEVGRVVMFGPAFKRWIYLTVQTQISPAELGRRLRGVGCVPDKINVEEVGKRTSRSIWRLSEGWTAKGWTEVEE